MQSWIEETEAMIWLSTKWNWANTLPLGALALLAALRWATLVLA